MADVDMLSNAVSFLTDGRALASLSGAASASHALRFDFTQTRQALCIHLAVRESRVANVTCCNGGLDFSTLSQLYRFEAPIRRRRGPSKHTDGTSEEKKFRVKLFISAAAAPVNAGLLIFHTTSAFWHLKTM